jgi:hypothetical protein
MQFRDVMAPDTDPTDDELAIVAREALEIALKRNAESDRRIALSLRQAAIDADKNRLPPRKQENKK